MVHVRRRACRFALPGGLGAFLLPYLPAVGYVCPVELHTVQCHC